jgi:hypothetical protein
MKKDFTPKSRKENLVIQELEGEVLIYDLEKNKALCLNQTSALVWQSCDGNRTIAEISDFVGKQLKTQVDEDVVWLALDQLSKENLVKKELELGGKFKGLSRREVIKKVGLGTMIALPLITALVAPLPIHAASTCVTPPLVCSCTTATPPGGTCGQGNAILCAPNCLCTRGNACGPGGNCAGTCG